MAEEAAAAQQREAPGNSSSSSAAVLPLCSSRSAACAALAGLTQLHSLLLQHAEADALLPAVSGGSQQSCAERPRLCSCSVSARLFGVPAPGVVQPHERCIAANPHPLGKLVVPCSGLPSPLSP
jgi:hypothetical protein